jgi:hypothetical protein
MRIQPEDLVSPERVEQLRRSLAMTLPDSPALDAQDAGIVLGALGAALQRLRATA